MDTRTFIFETQLCYMRQFDKLFIILTTSLPTTGVFITSGNLPNENPSQHDKQRSKKEGHAVPNTAEVHCAGEDGRVDRAGDEQAGTLEKRHGIVHGRDTVLAGALREETAQDEFETAGKPKQDETGDEGGGSGREAEAYEAGCQDQEAGLDEHEIFGEEGPGELVAQRVVYDGDDGGSGDDDY